jgi:hypothetical protein
MMQAICITDKEYNDAVRTFKEDPEFIEEIEKIKVRVVQEVVNPEKELPQGLTIEKA